MNFKSIWDESVSLYKSLEVHKCLCFCKKSSFSSFLKVCFESFSDTQEECKLLCMNIVRLGAETYVADINTHKKSCKELLAFFTELSKEEIFFKLVEIYITSNDLHISWTCAKVLSVILYGTELSSAAKRLDSIIKRIMTLSSDNECIQLIELIHCVMSYGLRVTHNNNDSSNCPNAIECILSSIKEHYCVFCSELAHHWNDMTKLFIHSNSLNLKNEASFLLLWKLIIDNPVPDDVYGTFLNKQFVIDFLSYLDRPEVVSLYLQIMIQIFCSSLKYRPWVASDSMVIEKTVCSALSKDLLKSLITYNQEFCSVIKNTSSERSLNCEYENVGKLSVITKKILFIILSLLAEFKNIVLLSEAYKKIMEFLSEKNMLCPFWVVNLFLDEDDLLFGSMLSSLRIYQLVKNGLRSEQTTMEMFLHHDTNPHAAFFSLLHLLGFDHNELISFLMSDETCCLLYLTEYLNLLLNDRDQFIKTYASLANNKTFQKPAIARKKKLKDSDVCTSLINSRLIRSESKVLNDSVSCNVTDCDSDGFDCVKEKSSKEILKLPESEREEQSLLNDDRPSACISLVTYSCSSSSESNSEDEDEFYNLSHFVSVMISLKRSIQKSVNNGIFPYNVSPLLLLLTSFQEVFS